MEKNQLNKQKLISVFIIVLLTTGFFVGLIKTENATATGTEYRIIQWQMTDTYLDSDAEASLNQLIAAHPDATHILIDMRISISGSTASPYLTRETEYTTAFDLISAAGKGIVGRIRVPNQVTLDPTDKTTFFSTYATSCAYWAALLESYGADLFIIGTENTRLEQSDYDAGWNSVTNSVRAVFSGEVSYETNYWFQSTGDYNSRAWKMDNIGWWSNLDYLTVSCYWDVAPSLTASVEEIKAGWYSNNWEHINVLNEITWISGNISKPVIMVTGCASQDGAAIHPWDFDFDTVIVDLEEQRRYYEAFFQVWYNHASVAGFSFDGAWFTRSNPSSNNNEFTVQNKPASDTLTAWFSQLAASSTTDYFFSDDFESGDFSGWTGFHETDYRYHFVDVATNNPHTGTYNLNATIVQTASNAYACAYQNITGIGTEAWIKAFNVSFTDQNDEGESQRFLGFGSSVTSQSLIASAGVITDGGVIKPVIRGIYTGTTFANYICNTTTLETDTDYIMQFGMLSSNDGWYKFYITYPNGTSILALDISGVDTNGRTLTYAAAGFLASNAPDSSKAEVYLDSVSVDSAFMAEYYTLTMGEVENGLVNPYPANDDFIYAEGTNITLFATPNDGYEFATWEIDGVNETTTESTWFVVMDADHTAKAYFTLLPTPTPTPTVTPTPTATPIIKIGETQNLYFRSDTYDTLNETAYGLDTDYTNTVSTSNTRTSIDLIQYAIKVYIFSANTETQLTNGYSAVITLTNASTGGNYSGFVHGYWNIPNTNVILGYQALKVEVYSYTPTSLWTLEKTFITPVLITKEIVASTLDFKLYVTTNFTTPSTMGGSADVTSFFSFGNPTYKSGVFGLQVVTPKQSEVQLWRVNSGDYIGFEIGAYVDVIGEAFYVLLIILCGGILYFRYGHFGVIAFAFTLSGVMGGVLWVFIPAWAAAVACALILLGTTFMVWRVIR